MHDLKTSQNELSVWRVETASPLELESVLVALATAPEVQRFGAIDLVWTDEGGVAEAGIVAAQSPGLTAAMEAAGLHRDLTGLSSGDIATLSDLFHSAIGSGQTRRYPASVVRSLVLRWLEEDRVDRLLMNPDLLRQLT